METGLAVLCRCPEREWAHQHELLGDDFGGEVGGLECRYRLPIFYVLPLATVEGLSKYANREYCALAPRDAYRTNGHGHLMLSLRGPTRGDGPVETLFVLALLEACARRSDRLRG